MNAFIFQLMSGRLCVSLLLAYLLEPQFTVRQGKGRKCTEAFIKHLYTATGSVS